MRPHLTTIAARMEEMWAAHKLGTGERNVLCDAMLAASASGGPELRTQVCACHLISPGLVYAFDLSLPRLGSVELPFYTNHSNCLHGLCCIAAEAVPPKRLLDLFKAGYRSCAPSPQQPSHEECAMGGCGVYQVSYGTIKEMALHAPI